MEILKGSKATDLLLEGCRVWNGQAYNYNGCEFKDINFIDLINNNANFFQYEFPFDLTFDNCTFNELMFSSCVFKGSVHFVDCSFEGSSLIMQNCRLSNGGGINGCKDLHQLLLTSGAVKGDSFELINNDISIFNVKNVDFDIKEFNLLNSSLSFFGFSNNSGCVDKMHCKNTTFDGISFSFNNRMERWSIYFTASIIYEHFQLSGNVIDRLHFFSLRVDTDILGFYSTHFKDSFSLIFKEVGELFIKDCVFESNVSISVSNGPVVNDYFKGVVSSINISDSIVNRSLTISYMVIRELVLNGTTLKGPFFTKGSRFLDYPDFTQTAIGDGIVLSKLDMPNSYPVPGIIPKMDDIAKIRRLKDISIKNEDNDSALNFFARELAAIKFHGHAGSRAALFSMYKVFSDYGRSIFRPALSLFFLFLVSSLVYIFGSDFSSDFPVTTNNEYYGLILSLQQSIPVTFGLASESGEYVSELYPKGVPWFIRVYSIVQSILSVIFIFLAALAVRNWFKI